MIIVRFLIFTTIIICNAIAGVIFDNEPIISDSRIKTYTYNQNKVYPLILHFGFQSSIEFAKNEEIQSITIGEPYAVKITQLDNVILIKPLDNVMTNMFVKTDKRYYNFDIIANNTMKGRNFVYVIRFIYP